MSGAASDAQPAERDRLRAVVQAVTEATAWSRAAVEEAAILLAGVLAGKPADEAREVLASVCEIASLTGFRPVQVAMLTMESRWGRQAMAGEAPGAA